MIKSLTKQAITHTKWCKNAVKHNNNDVAPFLIVIKSNLCEEVYSHDLRCTMGSTYHDLELLANYDLPKCQGSYNTLSFTADEDRCQFVEAGIETQVAPSNGPPTKLRLNQGGTNDWSTVSKRKGKTKINIIIQQKREAKVDELVSLLGAKSPWVEREFRRLEQLDVK